LVDVFGAELIIGFLACAWALRLILPHSTPDARVSVARTARPRAYVAQLQAAQVLSRPITTASILRCLLSG
jgi:hypothetical protein